jgi:hypothetical protein
MRTEIKVILPMAVFLMILIAPKAHALSIAMDVGEQLNADLKTINTSLDNGLYWTSVEFYNSGSIGYRATARLDIFSGETKVFTSWSDTREMAPGKKEYFSLYGYVNQTGNYSLRLRIYFANEILEKWHPASQWNVIPRQSMFMVRNVFSGKDFVDLEIQADRDINAVILPADYPQGWVFQSSEISLKENQTLKQRVFYTSDMPLVKNATIIVSSKDGNYVTTSSFRMMPDDENVITSLVSFLGSIFR